MEYYRKRYLWTYHMGFEEGYKRNKTCMSKKSLYGLKQSPIAWFELFTKSIKSDGYAQGQAVTLSFTNILRMENHYFNTMLMTSSQQKMIMKNKRAWRSLLQRNLRFKKKTRINERHSRYRGCQNKTKLYLLMEIYIRSSQRNTNVVKQSWRYVHRSKWKGKIEGVVVWPKF